MTISILIQISVIWEVTSIKVKLII